MASQVGCYSHGMYTKYIDPTFYTPEMFGAIGNGIVDDVVPVQDCINAAAGRYDVVLTKLYGISTQINVPDHSTVKSVGGRGLDVGFIALAGCATRMLSMGSYCSIEDLGLDGAGICSRGIHLSWGTTRNVFKSVFVTRCSRQVELEGSYFNNFENLYSYNPTAGGSHIYIHGLSNANWFRGFDLLGVEGYGVNIQAGNNNHFISGNFGGGGANAIFCSGSENWWDGCYFEGWDNTILINFSGTRSIPASGNVVKDCHLCGYAGTTEALVWNSYAPNTKIQNCQGYYATQVWKVLCFLGPGSDGCLLEGNWIDPETVANGLWSYTGSVSWPIIIDYEKAIETIDTAAPIEGSYSRGSRCWRQDATLGGAAGWVCVTAGTMGALGGAPTGTARIGRPILIPSVVAGLTIGQYLDVVGGFTGARIRRAISALAATTVNVDSAIAQPVLSVAVVANFEAGNSIIIGRATAREEVAVILSVQATTLTLTSNLAFAHDAVDADPVENCFIMSANSAGNIAGANITYHTGVWELMENLT